MASLAFELDIQLDGFPTDNPKKGTTIDVKACRKIVKSWKFTKYSEIDYLYHYLVPASWYLRFINFRSMGGPYPGPIDYGEITTENGELILGSTKSEIQKKITNSSEDTQTVYYNHVYFSQMVEVFGLIGTPICRFDPKKDKYQFDMALGKFCTKVHPDFVRGQRNLYRVLLARGYRGGDVYDKNPRSQGRKKILTIMPYIEKLLGKK